MYVNIPCSSNIQYNIYDAVVKGKMICFRRCSKDSFQERDYGYNHSHDQNNDHDYENKFGQEYEGKSKYYEGKDENSNDSYGGSFDRESSHNSKT